MADNVDITPGSGATVAADLISGALYQRIKLSIGADGSAADLAFGQTTLANSLSVGLASNHGNIPVTGSVSITNTNVSVTGNVGITNSTIGVTGTVGISNTNVPVTGSVGITNTNIPVTGTVGISNSNLSVTGTVLVSNTVTVDTELPAAAALSDSLSNPTTPQVGANLLGWDGSQWNRVRVPSTFKDLNATSIPSITTVWTPTSGKKFRLMGGCISTPSSVSLLFEDNSTGNFIFRTPTVPSGIPYNFDVPGGRLSSTINNVLKLTTSSSTTITGTIWGTEE